uniref:Uncharacterized protein n=2 Tax=Oryza TaxID=4527 RepID=Q10PW7_ORYSJ|nr:hypothetical protein LOC_Os03g11930 [Oryza sativa Japonica Group]
MARPIDDDGCHGASQGAAAVGTARHKRGKDGAVSVLEPSTSRELRELIIRSCSSHRRSYWGFSAGERRRGWRLRRARRRLRWSLRSGGAVLGGGLPQICASWLDLEGGRRWSSATAADLRRLVTAATVVVAAVGGDGVG